MNKKMHYLVRTLQIISLIVISTVIVYQFSILESTSNQIKYQQTERFSYSLTNLAAAEATRYLDQKKTKDLRLLIDDLSHDPIVRDATIYDDLGRVIYQSDDVLTLQTLLNINDDNSPQAQGVIPYIAELYTENKKIGYIRITLEQDKILSLIHDYQENIMSTMWLLLILSFAVGILLMALFFRKLETLYSHIVRGLNELMQKNRLYW